MGRDLDAISWSVKFRLRWEGNNRAKLLIGFASGSEMERDALSCDRDRSVSVVMKHSGPACGETPKKTNAFSIPRPIVRNNCMFSLQHRGFVKAPFVTPLGCIDFEH